MDIGRLHDRHMLQMWAWDYLSPYTRYVQMRGLQYARQILQMPATNNMKITRVWSMPNRWSFQIKPIKELISRYVGDGKGWADPFAGKTVCTEFRNNFETTRIDARDYIKEVLKPNSLNGILLDPPYSYRQLFKTYKNGGSHLKGLLVPMTEINDLSAPLVKTGGYAISFGWNSNGLGLKRGFVIDEVLLISHGGHHNDTIVTVEKREGKA